MSDATAVLTGMAAFPRIPAQRRSPENRPAALTCNRPGCDGEIRIITEPDDYGRSISIVGIECTDCPAQWDAEGKPNGSLLLGEVA